MRTLASIQKVLSIEPIPDADQIEKITVLGWELVTKKNEFKVGDLCVYCECDSILPERPEFEFLAPVKYRIKTRRMKGQISQGIAFPLSILNSVGTICEVFGEQMLDVTDTTFVTNNDSK